MSRPSLSEATVVRQADRTAARVLGGQAVIVVIDEQALHTLNGVGTRVWELAQSASLRDIASTIAEEYEVSAARARTDVEKFVREMLERGALEIVSS